MSELIQPSLLACLDGDFRVSSKWVAKETDKKHFHVTRDIVSLINRHPDLDAIILRNSNETWIPLEVAILLLAGYSGPKAIAAEQMLLTAVRYFIHRAPYVEQRLKESDEDNARLRTENQTLAGLVKPAAKRLSKALRRTVASIAGDLIGGMALTFSTKPLFEMTDWQQDLAHIPAMMKQAETLQKHIVERFDAGRNKFLSHMRGLGLDEREAEEAFRDAVRIMCRGQQIEVDSKLPN